MQCPTANSGTVSALSATCPSVRGKKKGLASLQGLDFICVFFAPRPGLEPGTYGLTVPPPNGPQTRANAGFSLFGCLIFSPSFAKLLPGSDWFVGRISDRSLGWIGVL